VTEKIDDRHYKAAVRVKLGPMQMAYRGDITIVEADETTRRTVMEAKATETKGQGTARATITTSLASAGGGTHADVTTELQLTGRVAQMGRGIVENVSKRLMGEFADCLSRQASSPEPAATAEPEAPVPAAKPIGGFGLLLQVLRERLRHPFARG